MTTRNLDARFAARAIAIDGISVKPGSVGEIVARNLFSGGFNVRIILVNPRATEVLGQPCYPSAASLPKARDLAVTATPPRIVPGLIADLRAAE
jgi:acetyltransferase